MVNQTTLSFETQKRVTGPSMHLASGTLQRKCACGGTPGPSGECEECRKNRLGVVQRSAVGTQSPGVAPAIVHEVLRSPGRPLDAGLRASMEPRFGHDFSRVRIHMDARAAESARAVNALAYTVGRDLVFGAGQYAPATLEGRKLIAHELAHVVQQGLASNSVVAAAENNRLERAATVAANQVATGQSVALSTGQTAIGLQRQPAGGGSNSEEECIKGWENDPESLSIHVARHFVATEIDPTLADQLATTKCVNDHDCIVTLGSDLVIDVHWIKSTRRVGAGRNTDQGRRFCAFEYSCDSNSMLKLKLIKCLGNPQTQAPQTP